MTKENIKLGSEYGIEVKRPLVHNWASVNQPGEGFESYEEAYQKVLKLQKEWKDHDREYRVVVYDYNRSGRKNFRVLTFVGD